MLTTQNAAPVIDDPLRDSERDKYRRIWDCREYHHTSPGARQVASIEAELRARGVKSIVELGAGSGRLAFALALRGFDVRMIDIAENCLDPNIRAKLSGRLGFTVACAWDESIAELRADATLSTDFFEHVPPDRVDQTIDICRQIGPHGFHGIALDDDVCGKLIGEKLHLTIESMSWWRERFEQRFEDVKARKVQTRYIQLRY